MLQTHSPIKRSKQLAGLSREHHSTLLFVWKIKQGIAYEIDGRRIGNYCEWYWYNHLKGHFKKEEKALSKVMPPYDVLMNNMIEDHEAIRLQVEEVITYPSYQSLKRLAQIIYYHIRFEERMLFPHVESTVTAEALEEAALLLAERQETIAAWPDEFWLNLQ